MGGDVLILALMFGVFACGVSVAILVVLFSERAGRRARWREKEKEKTVPESQWWPFAPAEGDWR